jgi:hypothetical protein
VNFFDAYTSGDGVSWASTSNDSTEFVQTVLTLGNPGATPLQMISLDFNGIPNLWYDASGNGTDFIIYDSGPLPNVDNLTFSTLAARKGADGNLQVVLLSVVNEATSGALPYLIWQAREDGSWHDYDNPSGQGYQLPIAVNVNVVDLAVGMGNQAFLQVGYIGSDSNIYVNWQDSAGTWGFFGPLPGA